MLDGMRRVSDDRLAAEKFSSFGRREIVLELRVSNLAAKRLYTEAGYCLVNRLTKYYSDGEDCFLMVKSLV